MNLPYFAADTLGVTLYQMKDQLKAKEIRQIRLDAWRLDLEIDVVSDLWGGAEAGFWVTLGKVLRMYLIVRNKENWLYVLDAKALKECGAKTGFSGFQAKQRVEEFKPAIRGAFRWKDGTWEKIASANVLD